MQNRDNLFREIKVQFQVLKNENNHGIENFYKTMIQNKSTKVLKFKTQLEIQCVSITKKKSTFFPPGAAGYPENRHRHPIRMYIFFLHMPYYFTNNFKIFLALPKSLGFHFKKSGQRFFIVF